MSGFSHRALLYAAPGEFVAAAGPYVREGVEAGDSVIAVTTRANIRALREELGDLAEVYVKGKVDESDIGRVLTGRAVAIRLQSRAPVVGVDQAFRARP